LAVLRFARLDGWIGRVHVTPAELTADVCGSRIAGCELELYGESDRSSRRLAGPGAVVFPLDLGLPASAWLWLKQGTSWLDYRSIDARSGWTGGLAGAGVEFDLPVDPQASVEALLAAGEGPQTEYKRQLPDTADQKRRMLKTAAAFATQDGGTMVFGMDPDDLTVTGLGGQDPKNCATACTHWCTAPSSRRPA
jgi:Putative DNA-binding domain